ncbi:DUF6114 domain-containing protein [Streptomyces sp. NPDC057062]|uniref:DUF6114 domain-containing protein n=1 Tax=unclassified Streptomyces TaxID=2593676 RepID=UPI001C6F135E|nr:DUF6114 domain-containing protein [Streptomyces sp. MBT84]
MSDPRPARRTTATAVAGVERTFRTWRAERPFWAGAFTVTAGLTIICFSYTDLDLQGIVLALSTTSGTGALIIGVLLVVLGLSLWFQQQHRVFAGIAALLLSLTSFALANFGGLFLGLTCGLIGGSLACAWMPAPDPPTAEEDRESPQDWEEGADLENVPDRGGRKGKDEQERLEGREERTDREGRGDWRRRWNSSGSLPPTHRPRTRRNPTTGRVEATSLPATERGRALSAATRGARVPPIRQGAVRQPGTVQAQRAGPCCTEAAGRVVPRAAGLRTVFTTFPFL